MNELLVKHRRASASAAALIASATCGAYALADTNAGARGTSAAPSNAAAPAALARTRQHARARCPRGHVKVDLQGPRLVVPQRRISYVVLARACPQTRALGAVRVSLRGPRRVSWSLRRLRSDRAAPRRVTLTFAATARAPRSATVVLEARSKRGSLLGRRRVTIKFALRASPVAPAPPPPGAVVGWGANGLAQVGAGFRSGAITVPMTGLVSGVRQVVASYYDGYALLDDGTIRAWGSNEIGQLGDGTRTDKVNPTAVQGLSNVVQIAAGGAHVMALLANGTVYTWGSDLFGMLGNGTEDPHEGVAHPAPVQVPGLSGVVAISAGAADDAAILANGTVVAWGENKAGQLGDGTTQDKLTPTPITALSNVRAVALGGVSSIGGHMLALLGNGTVMASGENKHGQLGLGDTSNRLIPVAIPGLAGVRAISANASHSLAIGAGGEVLSWGVDTDGELGYGAVETCEGDPCSRIPRGFGLTNVSAVAAGLRFSVAIKEEQVFSWGSNDRGQLGTGSTTSSGAPQEVPGVAGVTGISASEGFVLTTAGQGPSADLHVVPEPGGLLLQWTPHPGSQEWTVSWRPFTKPRSEWSKRVTLSAATTSYLITGLTRVPYEVRLTRVGETFGYRIGFGVPE